MFKISKKVVKPVCVVLIVGPILFIAIVTLVEVIKHGWRTRPRRGS